MIAFMATVCAVCALLAVFSDFLIGLYTFWWRER